MRRTFMECEKSTSAPLWFYLTCIALALIFAFSINLVRERQNAQLRDPKFRKFAIRAQRLHDRAHPGHRIEP